jgi:hypothetical protein
MKKLAVFMVFGFVFCLASSSLAAITFTDEGAQSASFDASSVLNDYKTSTNVTLIGVGTSATYAAVSSHLQGTRVFGSSSQDSIIYTLDAGKDAGTAYTTAPTNSDSSEFASGWTSL